VTHSVTFVCNPGQVLCGSALMLVQPFLYHTAYSVEARFDNPLRPFVDAGVPFTNFGNQTANGTLVGVTVRGAHLT
jgi:hypothetical protein